MVAVLLSKEGKRLGLTDNLEDIKEGKKKVGAGSWAFWGIVEYVIHTISKHQWKYSLGSPS